MTRSRFRYLHRIARLGNLGSLSAEAGYLYGWLLEQVYDLRFPHIGQDRHAGWPRCFDPLRISTAIRLKWKRQSGYAAHVRFCTRCRTHHHNQLDCIV